MRTRQPPRVSAGSSTMRPRAIARRRGEQLAHDRGVFRMQVHAHVARGSRQARDGLANDRDDLRGIGLQLAAHDLLADREREQRELLFDLARPAPRAGATAAAGSRRAARCARSARAMRACDFRLARRRALPRSRAHGSLGARSCRAPFDRRATADDRALDRSAAFQRSTAGGWRASACGRERLRHTLRPLPPSWIVPASASLRAAAGFPSARLRLRTAAPGPWLRGRPSASRPHAATCS